MKRESSDRWANKAAKSKSRKFIPYALFLKEEKRRKTADDEVREAKIVVEAAQREVIELGKVAAELQRQLEELQRDRDHYQQVAHRFQVLLSEVPLLEKLLRRLRDHASGVAEPQEIEWLLMWSSSPRSSSK